jgi:hypothetical protein
MSSRSGVLAALFSCLLLTSCLGAGGMVSQGSGGTAVTGATAGSTSVGANESLERCSEPLGTLAVDDGREETWWYAFSSRTQVTSIEPMIRTLAQQSNCFVVTSVGNERLNRRFDQIRQQTRESGEFRAGSNYQKGQAIAADYFLEPTILFASSDAGGLGGAVGSYLGPIGTVVGGAFGSEKHTTVNLSLFGIREGAQISASEGSASSNDLAAFFGGYFGNSVPAGLAGYTKTPEGKATVAAFVDAYNQMIVALKNYEAQNVKGGLGRGGALKFQGS